VSVQKSQPLTIEALYVRCEENYKVAKQVHPDAKETNMPVQLEL